MNQHIPGLILSVGISPEPSIYTLRQLQPPESEKSHPSRRQLRFRLRPPSHPYHEHPAPTPPPCAEKRLRRKHRNARPGPAPATSLEYAHSAPATSRSPKCRVWATTSPITAPLSSPDSMPLTDLRHPVPTPNTRHQLGDRGAVCRNFLPFGHLRNRSSWRLAIFLTPCHKVAYCNFSAPTNGGRVALPGQVGGIGFLAPLLASSYG